MKKLQQPRQRLLDVGFIRVQYPTWLANIVMVKKKNGEWRMCTNFTDLNKCCPKDDFPLSRIDKVVDSATGCEMMALLEKCVFSVERGKVLECLVSIKGIKANPDKINAIIHMKPPQSKKEVQNLSSRIAALN
jgi:hypothetical protein